MRYIFGECTLDTQRYELCRGGRVSRLRHKVLQVLVYLLAHTDRIVSKQELREQIWPQQFISEAALESTIKAVRQAIGDSGRGQQLIQTIYGQGYRFLAPVEVHPEAATGATGAGLLAPRSTTPLPPHPHLGATASAQDSQDRSPRLCRRRGASLTAPLPPPEGKGQYLGTAGPPDSDPETDARVEEASLQHSASAAAGERKLVTVLCCALAETPTGAAREVEPQYNALRALYTLAREVVQRYGGTLQPVVSAQIVAIFGVPLAQEDHARCAVLAALDLQQHLRQHPTLHPAARDAELVVRLGIDSGLVIVGDVGLATHRQATVVGAPVQGALQLQQQAAPGTLLVSAATYHLVQEEVHGEPCGSLVLDGRQEPLPVYAVHGLVQRRAGVPQRAPWARSPFVGRQRELALLHDRLEAVRAGEGQVVSLVGPPGVGKTRLLTEFARCLAPHQVTWYLGQCLAYGQAMPYLPVRDIFQQVCAIAPGDAMETRTAAVRRRLAALGGMAEEDVALVLQLLDLPVAPETLGQHSPEAQQARTFALLGHLISHEAQRQPLVLAVENVHWIDPTSEAWLGFLVERLVGMAVLLLVTARPRYLAPWAAHAAVTWLALPPLQVQDSQAIVEAVSGAVQLPVVQRQQIVAHGAGNPFFVEELTWHAVEHGLAATPVPETVHAVLAARIDQLPAEAKDLLQTAAVIGPEVPVPLLQAITELPEDALQRCLAHLQSTELLYETRLMPERVYTFKHALTHDVAYGSLLQERRCALHAGIVEILEVCPRAQGGVEVEHLAYHALRGEVWDKAVVYFRQAGAQALARSAYREAVTSYEQALGALQHLPESHDTCAQAIDLRLDLRNALWTLGDLERLFANLQEAAGLADVLGDPHRLGWVSVYLLAHFAQVCDPDRALTSGQHALAMATTLGDIGLTVAAQHYLGGVYRSLGDYRQAVAYFQKNVACLQGALRHERLGLPGLASVFSRSHLVVSLAECGAFAEGQAPAAEGEQIAEAADHPYSRVMALWAVGFRALRQGDLGQAIPVLERALELVQVAYLRLAVPWIAAPLGAAYALAGRTADALPLLEQADAQAVAMHYMWDHALRVVWLSEGYLRAGRLAEAGIQAQRALEFARAHQERGHVAYALRLLGEVAARRQPPEVAQATAHYQQAVTLAEELGMRPLVAHCHLELGTLYCRLGRAQPARAALGAAMALYRVMGMTFWLPRAEAALAEVSG